MRIAKIVKSNSHVDYVGLVLGKNDGDDPPRPEHYRFGQFVVVPPPAGETSLGGDESIGETAVGIIYNSQLLNPDYERMGPRLTAPAEMNPVFSPDLVNEQGILIGVLLVGWHDSTGGWRQGIPRTVLPVNSEIITMDQDQLRLFHTDENARLMLHYYPHVITHARQFAQQLLISVLDQLEGLGQSNSTAEIALLRRTLNWQVTFQNKPL